MNCEGECPFKDFLRAAAKSKQFIKPDGMKDLFPLRP